MSSKSIGDKRNAAARAYVQELVNTRFAGNVLAASEALEVSQSGLYEFLRGTRGAGLKILDAVARYDHVTVDVILGGAGATKTTRAATGEPYPNRALVMATPEYEQASPSAKRAFRTIRGASGGEDKSVVEWVRILDAIIQADAMGVLESGGGVQVKPTTKK